jgi:hypothetical protein
MRPAALALAAVVALVVATAPSPARAEEGLFTARAAGGLSTVHPDMPKLGGVAQLGWTLGWTDAVVVSMNAMYVGHPAFDTASVGLGLRLQGDLGEWTHPYILVEPTFLLVFDNPEADPLRADFAGRAALGLDYLIMWGLGFTFEVSGTLPAGLSGLPFPEAASVSAAAGLYMEF